MVATDDLQALKDAVLAHPSDPAIKLVLADAAYAAGEINLAVGLRTCVDKGVWPFLVSIGWSTGEVLPGDSYWFQNTSGLHDWYGHYLPWAIIQGMGQLPENRRARSVLGAVDRDVFVLVAMLGAAIRNLETP